MKKPVPIFTKNRKVIIRVIGYKHKKSRSYIAIDYLSGQDYWTGSWIKNRDVKRLMKWCEDCLVSRKIK